MNPGLGTPAARERQAALLALAGGRPRRRRGAGPVTRRLGVTLVQMGWRLMGSDEAADGTVAALRRILA